ncbi:copper chaperone PCu(A)C [Bradyrhizobium sp. WYCCWR 13023]|uniref:Copper chaperone PCu(A)C n=1 Tax=Bradyrhizobium zhengyangense TaxID=2911009 RepID=A0A9X1RJ43_9BRAD|nr:copper chaperone PCu(A)C [Bradyrhizobium zhengyangense]MCG2631614.1 copper chaperone PCu(A)C [Bradyrhizobium zhengyangense]
MLEKFGTVAVILAAALTFVGSAPTLADHSDIVVSQAWSRATPKGAKVAGGYLTIENRGTSPDRLLSASSPAAAKVEVHQMTMQDGIMTMRPLEEGLAIPPDGIVTLAPGGNHIMFVGLTAPLEEGQRIPVSLNFQRAGTIEATFDVGSVGAKGPRLQIASTEAASPAAPPALKANATSVTNEPFFTHLCGTRVMADITVTPGHSGPVEVLVQLYDGEERPLNVDGLSVTLANPDKGIPPATASATRVAADKWRVSMMTAASGKWSLALGIDMTKDDRINIAAPILIE